MFSLHLLQQSIQYFSIFHFFTFLIPLPSFLLLSIKFFCFLFTLIFLWYIFFFSLPSSLFTFSVSFLCTDFFLLFILSTSSLFHSVNCLLKFTPSHSSLCFLVLHCVNVFPPFPPSVPFLPFSSSHSLLPLLT